MPSTCAVLCCRRPMISTALASRSLRGFKVMFRRPLLLVGLVPSAPMKEATADNAYSGSYPLARFLYVYVNKAPGQALDPLTREFVKLIVSKEGQEGVIKDGYFPIPASIAKEELNKVQ